LAEQNIGSQVCVVGAYPWLHATDVDSDLEEGFGIIHVRTSSSYGYVVRIDYWAHGDKSANVPVLDGKLFRPDGREVQIRAETECVRELYTCIAGDDYDAQADLEMHMQNLRNFGGACKNLTEVNRSTMVNVLTELHSSEGIEQTTMSLEDPKARTFVGYFSEAWTRHRCCYRGSTMTPVPRIEVLRIDRLINQSHTTAYF